MYVITKNYRVNYQIDHFGHRFLSTEIKTQKLPSADVWERRMYLRRRMGLPFTLGDRYDPKQVCQSIGWCMKAYRKFFVGLKCRHDVHQNTIFGAILAP